MPCMEGLCEIRGDFCPPQRKEEDRPLPAVEGGKACLVEVLRQLLGWLSVNDRSQMCGNSIWLQVKGLCLSPGHKCSVP